MSFRSKGEFPAHTFAETFFRGGGHKMLLVECLSIFGNHQDRLVAAIQKWKNHFE